MSDSIQNTTTGMDKKRNIGEDGEGRSSPAQLRPHKDDKDDEPATTGAFRNGCVLGNGAGIGYSSPSNFNTNQPTPRKRELVGPKDPLEQLVKEMDVPLESGDMARPPPPPPPPNKPQVCSPPPYEHATDKGLTEVKRPVSEGDSLETDSTEKKFTSNSDTGGSSSDDEDSETDEKIPWEIQNKNYLMGVIEDLQREQEEIRQKQMLHEQHIKELLEREPCVHKSFQSIRRTMSRDTSSGGSSTGVSDKKVSSAMPRRPPANRQLHKLLADEKIYVQLEQLYTNFHVIHFPNKTMQTILGESRDPTYYDVSSSNEMRKLRDENSRLTKKVKVLEEKLKSKERELRRAASPQPHLLSPPALGFHSSRSEGRLDQMGSPTAPRKHNFGTGTGSRQNLTAGTPTEQFFVAGRPMSPLPVPVMPKDLCPVEATFKWTIAEYHYKFHEHRRTEGLREISSPFYITHGGYRAQLETYLNGNGTGTDRCMSVFLRVIKGDFDRHLKWPVNLHLDVILVNQIGNHSDSLKAGGNQFQYTKPQGISDAESDSWGLVEFVSHEMIRQRQYINNDKIMLKCKIQLLS